MALTHRSTRLAMEPFVELPLTSKPLATGFRERLQLPMGQFLSAESMKEPHPKPADKRPDPAVVIVVGEVHEIYEEIVFPVIGA